MQTQGKDATTRRLMDKYEELLSENDTLKAWVDVLKHDNQALRALLERYQVANYIPEDCDLYAETRTALGQS